MAGGGRDYMIVSYFSERIDSRLSLLTLADFVLVYWELLSRMAGFWVLLSNLYQPILGLGE